jgi:hypothetical protein
VGIAAEKELRRLDMVDFICLAALYPTKGIVGCLEAPIKEAELPQSFLSEVGESAHLSELKKLSGRAAKWFLPGDIVVRYAGFGELGSDVFRAKRDVVLIHGASRLGMDMDMLEKIRSESIEGHRWSMERGESQYVLCDPFGRAFVVANGSGKATPCVQGKWQVFKLASDQIVPKGVNSHQRTGFQETAAWFALQFAHAQMLSGDGSWAAYRRVNKLCRQVFMMKRLMGPRQRTKQMVVRRNPVYTRSKIVRPYWGRVEQDDDAPECLKQLLVRESDGRWPRQREMSFEEFEQVLWTCGWDEYRPGIRPWEFGYGKGAYGNCGRNKTRWFRREIV